MAKTMPYQAYLIRLWPTERAGLADYRVTLECVATGQRRSFPDLDGLVAFLEAQGAEWEGQGHWEDRSNQVTGQSSPEGAQGGPS